MFPWWQELAGPARFFWIVALSSSLFQILLFLGSFFTGHDFDHGTDAHDHGGGGVKVLSIRAIVAFLVGFGWTGALLLGDGMSFFQATAIAILVGFAFMMMIFLIMRALMSLQSNGTLDYKNAIGQEGQVYVTIPPNRTSPGQVEVMFQGRLITTAAITDSPVPLSPNTRILVDSVEGTTMLVVSPVHWNFLPTH